MKFVRLSLLQYLFNKTRHAEFDSSSVSDNEIACHARND